MNVWTNRNVGRILLFIISNKLRQHLKVYRPTVNLRIELHDLHKRGRIFLLILSVRVFWTPLIIVKLFVFNDSVNCSLHTVSNVITISEKWIGKDVEGNGCGIIGDNILAFVLKGLGKSQKPHSGEPVFEPRFDLRTFWVRTTVISNRQISRWSYGIYTAFFMGNSTATWYFSLQPRAEIML
jgi:hypothetical protein